MKAGEVSRRKSNFYDLVFLLLPMPLGCDRSFYDLVLLVYLNVPRSLRGG